MLFNVYNLSRTLCTFEDLTCIKSSHTATVKEKMFALFTALHVCKHVLCPCFAS